MVWREEEWELTLRIKNYIFWVLFALGRVISFWAEMRFLDVSVRVDVFGGIDWNRHEEFMGDDVCSSV